MPSVLKFLTPIIKWITPQRALLSETPSDEGVDTKVWVQKLQAWWQGVEYNTPSIEPRVVQKNQAASGQKSQPAAATNNPEPANAKHIAPENMDASDDAVWPSIRLTLAQQIWGEGFCMAGGMDYVLSLAKHFSPLVKDMILLDANPQLGGGMLWISKKYDLTIHGFESCQPLLRSGKAYLARMGAQIVPLRNYNPEKFELAKDYYDCVLLREFLYQVDKKELYLNQICQSLKDRGQIIITDLVRVKSGEPSKRLQDWINNEPGTVKLSNIETTLAALKERGDIEIRGIDDISSRYAKEIVTGWKRYLSTVIEHVPRREFLPWILKEVKIWAKRIEMIQSGELAVFRIYARRKPILERKPK